MQLPTVIRPIRIGGVGVERDAGQKLVTQTNECAITLWWLPSCLPVNTPHAAMN